MKPATGGQSRHHRRGQLALIKGFGAPCGNFTQARGQSRLAHNAAGARRFSLDQKARRLGFAQLCGRRRPIMGHARRHHIAMLGITDRRGQNLVHGFAAIGRQQTLPGAHGAGNRHHMRRSLLPFGHPGTVQRRNAGAGRGPPGAIQRDHRLAERFV